MRPVRHLQLQQLRHSNGTCPTLLRPHRWRHHPRQHVVRWTMLNRRFRLLDQQQQQRRHPRRRVANSHSRIGYETSRTVWEAGWGLGMGRRAVRRRHRRHRRRLLLPLWRRVETQPRVAEMPRMTRCQQRQPWMSIPGVPLNSQLPRTPTSPSRQLPILRHKQRI